VSRPALRERLVLQRMLDLDGGLFAEECSLPEKVALTRLSARGVVRIETCPVTGWVATLTANARALMAWGHP
jgi:hypothetical protein